MTINPGHAGLVWGIKPQKAPTSMHLSRYRTAAAFLTAVVGAMTWLTAPTAAEGQAVHVIEMFTSQGCSSCPPADRLLKTFAGRTDVIALSFHVDYWDRLGWKDTFGSPAFTKRQRDYALRRGDGKVYTPQAVINGRLHEVGHNRSAIERAMSASDAAAQRVPVTLSLKSGQLRVTAASASGQKSAGGIVTLLGVQTQGAVTATRGENSGERLAYTNIVRSMTTLGPWLGSSFETSIAVSHPSLAGADAVVVLIQRTGDGPIIGATWLGLK